MAGHELLREARSNPQDKREMGGRGRVACLEFDSVVDWYTPFPLSLSSCIQCMDTMHTPKMIYLRRDRQRGDVRHALLVLNELRDLANRNGPA